MFGIILSVRVTVSGAGGKIVSGRILCEPTANIDEDMFDYPARAETPEEAPRCPQCPGYGVELGDLGNVLYYRCRGCGWGWGEWG